VGFAHQTLETRERWCFVVGGAHPTAESIIHWKNDRGAEGATLRGSTPGLPGSGLFGPCGKRCPFPPFFLGSSPNFGKPDE
jgi:hypothetical protein